MDNMVVERILLETEGVVNISQDSPVEVKPGIFSPIYINLKHTLPDFRSRHTIVRRLSELIGDDVDCICGMESGGTYYASAVADVLLKPLILFRKADKDYGEASIRRIVGQTPEKGATVAIIDDVFATGITISSVVKYFQKIGCRVKLFAVFSYGSEEEIGKRLKVDVRALSKFENLMKITLIEGILSKEQIMELKKHVATYKDFLKERISDTR